MSTIKSYTTIEQSRKLAEILPLESADMRYEYPSREKDEIQEPMNGFHTSSFNWFKESDSFIYIPCWSLAALLEVLPKHIVYDYKDYNLGFATVADEWHVQYVEKYSLFYNRDKHLINACFKVVLKLNEYKLL